MDERMGQLQLNLLVDSIVASDRTAERMDPQPSQAVASRDR